METPPVLWRFVDTLHWVLVEIKIQEVLKKDVMAELSGEGS